VESDLAPVPAQRVPCVCGGRYSVRIVVEYVDPAHGRVDYAGGRFCYVRDALMEIGLPDGATPVQVTIYDWHEPDEVVRITFTRSAPDPDSPAEAGDGEQGAYLT
jgi:hypothetical protein